MSDERPPPNRTIFQPSPLQQMREAKQASDPQAPAAQPQQGFAPQQSGFSQPPPGAYQPPPVQPPAPPPMQMGTPMRSSVPPAPAGDAPRNILMSLAYPTLARLASVRSGRVRPSLPDLHRQVSADIGEYQAQLRGRVPEETARRAVYALAATADDIALNLPGQAADAANWAQRSLVVRLFQEAVGGDRFWRLLDEMVARPASNADLLELYHACMAAGFEGRFRVRPDGRQAHQALMQDVYRALPHVSQVSWIELSPHWRGEDARKGKLGSWAPLAIAGASCAAALLVIYIVLELLLAQSDHAAHVALASIDPEGPLTLSRPAAPPPQLADPALAGLRGFLAPEIKQGVVVVEANPTRVRTTVGQLFASGSADLVPDQKGLVLRIAQAMNSEPGDIRVEGYTDSSPSHSLMFPDNDALSKARSQTVADLIKANLKDPSRKITAVGLGESRPVGSNDTPLGKAQNRRVEVVLEPHGS